MIYTLKWILRAKSIESTWWIRTGSTVAIEMQHLKSLTWISSDIYNFSSDSSIHCIHHHTNLYGRVILLPAILLSIRSFSCFIIRNFLLSVVAIIIMKRVLDLRLYFMMWVYSECLGNQRTYTLYTVLCFIGSVSFLRVSNRIKSSKKSRYKNFNITLDILSTYFLSRYYYYCSAKMRRIILGNYHTQFKYT